MCYAVGSLQQATSTCPMCKVFRPSAARCPHIKDVCRNAAAHPRHDVIFLKNAEVQTFNGCGFCKWAKTTPPPTRAGYQNPGWPGCCRSPTAAEYKHISPADWHAVSIVHHIPIPTEIKAILDSITISPTRTAPGMTRRPSYPARTDTLPRSNPVAIPAKRSGGSPPQLLASLSGATRSGQGDGSPSSLPNASVMDQMQAASRRSAMDVFAEKRPDPSNVSQHSPGRKHAELSGSVSRRSTERRPSITSIAAAATISKSPTDATTQRRRTGTATSITPPALRSAERSVERAGDTASKRGGSVVDEVTEKVATMSVSSASSNSSGSSSDMTVTSDGGFTDYLSDESEAELQRQAELKAAIVAQNHMEEQEFRVARQQLAHSWRGNEVQSTPRSQIRVSATSRTSAGFGQSAFAAPAYAASAASAHSRG
ncbi:uncharacterized protein BXZ73DRAFT_87686 [Epithele typhae]|uniref:uncharacterized protein n=1 Tax=Epithele typhae TaxID=378194 RepID=UPI0020082E94|nr:uncharacterized protein BXZ73DRAFT_87686 [Epithele typhae]KAH9943334.1 hypothetical protein BXZ73DRAFT_87686 [Epithele typhae]